MGVSRNHVGWGKETVMSGLEGNKVAPAERSAIGSIPKKRHLDRELTRPW
jgi:hypothetical protein